MMWSVFWIVVIIGNACNAYFLLRGRRVFKFRLDVLKQCSIQAKRDIDMGRVEDWEWRYRAYESVPYARVYWSFKPLRAERFWHDLSFMQPYEEIVR